MKRTSSLLILLGIFCYHLAAGQQFIGLRDILVSHGDDLPANAKKLGSITVRMAHWRTFDEVVENAGELAKKKQGNTIVIQKVKYPALLRSRIFVEADVYLLDDVGVRITSKQHRLDSVVKSQLPTNAPYALLYVCRPQNYYGSAITYNLHVDDSVVCRVNNGHTYMIKLSKSGSTRIWGRTEARETVDIEVKPGEVYYLNCSVTTGIFVGRPSFHLTQTYYGIEELMRLAYKEN